MVTGLEPTHALDDLVLLPPIPNPEKLWCIGVNYRDRNAEYKDNSELPKYPSLFVRNPSSVVGSNQGIEKPKISEQLDYEGEMVIVIGRKAATSRASAAWDHIFGMTLCNEGRCATGCTTASSTSPRARISTAPAASGRGSSPPTRSIRAETADIVTTRERRGAPERLDRTV